MTSLDFFFHQLSKLNWNLDTEATGSVYGVYMKMVKSAMPKNKVREYFLIFNVFIYSKINWTQQGSKSLRSLKSDLGPLHYSDSIPSFYWNLRLISCVLSQLLGLKNFYLPTKVVILGVGQLTSQAKNT